MLLRVRLASFLAGVAVSGVAAAYLLRQDIAKSHQLLADQSQQIETKFEERISRLEAQLLTKKH
jgi:hypothetical protein